MRDVWNQAHLLHYQAFREDNGDCVNCQERGFDWSKAYHLVIRVASKPNTCNQLTTCSSSHACSNAQDFRTCRIDQSLPSCHHNLSLQCKESAALSDFYGKTGLFLPLLSSPWAQTKEIFLSRPISRNNIHSLKHHHQLSPHCYPELWPLSSKKTTGSHSLSNALKTLQQQGAMVRSPSTYTGSRDKTCTKHSPSWKSSWVIHNISVKNVPYNCKKININCSALYLSLQ
jgi:hypothetical protein